MTTQKQVVVPDIGDAKDVGVVEVLVKPGMHINAEQSIVVLESEKASMEIPAPFAGVVREVKVEVGASVSKGSLLLIVDPDDAAATGDEPAPDKKGTKQEAADKGADDKAQRPDIKKDVKVEVALSEQQEEGPAHDHAANAARTSARAELPPPLVLDDDGPRETIARNPATSLRPIAPRMASAPPPAPTTKLPHATPSVRRLARELGVDLTHLTGTGRSGRISKEDVQLYVKHAMSVVAKAGNGSTLNVAPLPEIDFSKFGETTLQPLTKIQKVSARNLHRSWVTIPHVTQFDKADITELEEFRKKSQASNKAKDAPKLTLLCFFMKAVVVVLKDMPKFNSSLDASGENLIMKQYFHIGIAVDTPNGLMVPVIRDVDLKGLHELAKELTDVSERARARRLSPDDMQGASMTISSLGGIGGTAFTPIINPPEVAILGVSRSEMTPVYQDGAFVPRLMCPLSLSYDHRVIDGADAARFTTKLRSVLSDIREMLL